MIKAALFDLDGTIAESEALHREAFNQLLQQWGLRITKKDWSGKFIGTGSRFIAQWYIRKYHLPVDLDEFVEQRRVLYQQLVKKHHLKAVGGFLLFYKALKKAGVKIAIASSGHHPNVVSTLHALRLHHIPIVSIEQVHFRKPNPEIFLKAAKKLHVKPKEGVVFEDSPVGITAAKRAKMKVGALLTTTTRARLKRLKPEMMVKDYRRLRVKDVLTL